MSSENCRQNSALLSRNLQNRRGCGAMAQVHQLLLLSTVRVMTHGSKAASNFLLCPASTRMYSCAILALLPVGVHPKIKPYLVGETARGLSPLLQRCPTLTLGSKNYSDSFPCLSTGVGISSGEMTRGEDLPLPNPFNLSV